MVEVESSNGRDTHPSRESKCYGELLIIIKLKKSVLQADTVKPTIVF